MAAAVDNAGLGSFKSVDSVIRTGEREDVKLKKPIPLYMTYVTAWANADGVVHFRDDIYARDDVGAVDTQARL